MVNYNMEIQAITTRLLIPPQDNALEAVIDGLDRQGGLTNGDVLAITSKIISLQQGRAVLVEDYSDKDQLIIAEAEHYLPRQAVPHGYAVLTIKNQLIAPSSGIDESNAQGYYILLPEQLGLTVQQWRQQLADYYQLKDLGVIITDSRSTPLRLGVVGVALAWAGFHPLRDYRGINDLFGRTMKISQSNIVDSLAAMAVYMMGEGSEQTPLARLRGLSDLQFTDQDCSAELWVDPEHDIYRPLYQSFLPGGIKPKV